MGTGLGSTAHYHHAVLSGLEKKNETLETETRLLQEKKAEAQEELKQVKAEIRTDKFKSAATDTATALASSVGSLSEVEE